MVARCVPGLLFLLVVGRRRCIRLPDGAVLHADAPSRHAGELLIGLIVEVFGDILRRRIQLSKWFEIIQHLMIDALDHRAHHLLEQLEIQQKAGLIQRSSGQGHADLIVMAVRIFALAAIVAEIVAGGEVGLYGDLVHGYCSILDGKASRSSHFNGMEVGAIVDSRVEVFTAPLPSSLARFFTTAIYLLKEMRHHADQSGDQARQQQNQRDRPPQRAVGGQPGLKARRDHRHARRDQREKRERAGEDVEITGHGRGDEDPGASSDSSGTASAGQLRAVDHPDPRLREFRLDRLY